MKKNDTASMPAKQSEATAPRAVSVVQIESDQFRRLESVIYDFENAANALASSIEKFPEYEQAEIGQMDPGLTVTAFTSHMLRLAGIAVSILNDSHFEKRAGS